MLFRIGAAQKSELLIFLVAISSDATCFVLNISYLTLHVSDCSLCGAAQKSAAIIYFPFLSAHFFLYFAAVGPAGRDINFVAVDFFLIGRRSGFSLPL